MQKSSEPQKRELTREDLLKSLREKRNEKLMYRTGVKHQERKQYIKENGGKRNAMKKALTEAEKQVDLLLQQFGLDPETGDSDLKKRLLLAMKSSDTKTIEKLIQDMSEKQMGVAPDMSSLSAVDEKKPDPRIEEALKNNLDNINKTSTTEVRTRKR